MNNTTEIELDDEEILEIVRHAYQYVALYNTNNNFAMDEDNPFWTGGWNDMFIATQLADADLQALPRPNNDTLYLITALDLRQDAIVIEFPEILSIFVSLETSAYDHYIDIPLATTYTGRDDFTKPTKVLFYTKRTENFNDDASIEDLGVDQIVEMTGDFSVAFLRVAPGEANEPEETDAIIAAMQKTTLMTLHEFLNNPGIIAPKPEPEFPAFSNDQAVFKNNFLEVMQFVFNYTTFNLNNAMDVSALNVMAKVGIQPGKTYDPTVTINGDKFAEIAEEVASESLREWNSEDNPYLDVVFLPKGEMTLNPMVVQSVVGPLGQPSSQALYPGLATADGEPMTSDKHYVIEMAAEKMPPANAFWSVTLYTAKDGFFIPNEMDKYSVGRNGGMELNENGGITIHISPEQAGESAANWLPTGYEEGDENSELLDVVMRIYAPSDGAENWKAPFIISMTPLLSQESNNNKVAEV